MNSQSKSQFFGTCNPIAIINYIPTFKLTCDTDKKDNGAKMCVLLYHVIRQLLKRPTTACAQEIDLLL